MKTLLPVCVLILLALQLAPCPGIKIRFATFADLACIRATARERAPRIVDSGCDRETIQASVVDQSALCGNNTCVESFGDIYVSCGKPGFRDDLVELCNGSIKTYAVPAIPLLMVTMLAAALSI